MIICEDHSPINLYRETVADPPFLPKIRVEYPATTDIADTLSDLMLDSQLITDASADPSAINVTIRSVSDKKSTTIDPFEPPKLKRLYHGPNPGQSYNRSAIRFYPMSGSKLWLSGRIGPNTNYYSNSIQPLIIHAAAINGCALLHSALISVNGFGILLIGESCSGKSSLALFSALSESKIVSDDLVLLATKGNKFHGRGFRSSFMARTATYEVLPAGLQKLATPVKINEEIKYLIRREVLPDRSISRSPIDAIAFPSVQIEGYKQDFYELKTLNKAAAISRIFACLNTTVLMPGLDKERNMTTRLLVDMTHKLPCFEMSMFPCFLNDPRESASMFIKEILSYVD